MKRILLLALSTLVWATINAQPVTNNEQRTTKIILLGTFHFDNPGLDVAQFKSADIKSTKRQAEVMEVVKALEAYKPDKIFIEAAAENQGQVDSSYQAYVKQGAALSASETQQLGYRVGKELGHAQLLAVDYRDADFPFDSLMKSAAQAGQTDFLAFIHKSIKDIEALQNHDIETKTISGILKARNSAVENAENVGFYYRCLEAGVKGNHVGSYLVSEWWRRNMVIYENILKRLDGKEKTILVIFGAGHTALLGEMMKFNPALEIIPVSSVLK